MTPTYSIVMPCYNAAEHLDLSVGSIRAQTRGDWELLVVDDGSTDTSWEVLSALASADDRIRIFRQANAGAAAARNRALAEVQGRYIAFLDSDDTWEPDFLETMGKALEDNPGAGIAYCGWANIGLGSARDKPFVPPDYETENKIELLLGGCRWPIHGAMTVSRLILDNGGFDETLSSCMDYDLWLRLGSTHPLVRVPRVLAYYHHRGSGQITSNRARIALNHRRAQLKYLNENPEVAAGLGTAKVRKLTDGELMHRGFISYWHRDLTASRIIFREVMKRGYGRPKDWLYMLPALLPETLHRTLIRAFEGRNE